MRRFAMLGLSMTVCGVLGGCSGFNHFIEDSFGLQSHHNAPLDDSETMRRVRGQDVATAPLLPEPGDIWPSTVPNEPMLSDLKHGETAESSPTPPSTARRSAVESEPAPALPPELTDPIPPPPGVAVSPSGADTLGQTFQTPNGPIKGQKAPMGGYSTLKTPRGGNGGIAIPNGNGTSTIIAPDGSVTTVPTPHDGTTP